MFHSSTFIFSFLYPTAFIMYLSCYSRGDQRWRKNNYDYNSCWNPGGKIVPAQLTVMHDQMMLSTVGLKRTV